MKCSNSNNHTTNILKNINSHEHQTIEGYKDFAIPDNWENTIAIMKLKQMIINNAKNQILVKRRFNI